MPAMFASTVPAGAEVKAQVIVFVPEQLKTGAAPATVALPVPPPMGAPLYKICVPLSLISDGIKTGYPPIYRPIL